MDTKTAEQNPPETLTASQNMSTKIQEKGPENEQMEKNVAPIKGQWGFGSNSQSQEISKGEKSESSSSLPLSKGQLIKQREKEILRQHKLDRKSVLLVKIPVKFQNNEVRKLEFLVDTGSEVNLLKKDVVPLHLWKKAETKINLYAANETLVQGGGDVCSVNCGS